MGYDYEYVIITSTSAKATSPTQFLKFANMDIRGYDVDHNETLNLDNCMRGCLQHSECVAFTWPGTNVCIDSFWT